MTMTVGSETDARSEHAAQSERAARAAASLLPSAAPLTPAPAVRTAADLGLSAGASAVIARFAGARSGEVVVVVDEEVVRALRESPMGQLDLPAAVRPALEAAAAAAGPCTVDVGREVSLDALPSPGPGLALVPLVHEGRVHAAVGLLLEPAATSSARTATIAGSGIDMLRHVELDVTAELGRTRMAVRDLLALVPGAVVELDRAAGSPADLLVNGKLIARGEVVVIDEHYGIRITEIVDATQGRS